MSNPEERKGYNRERELVNKFESVGYGVVRVPASGSASKRPLPDIVAGNGSEYIAVEAKSSSGDVIYIDGKEVEDLITFSKLFGAKARIGVRFDHEHWYFFHPGDVHVTQGGNYRIKKDFALREGEDFKEIVEGSRQTSLDGE